MINGNKRLKAVLLILLLPGALFALPGCSPAGIEADLDQRQVKEAEGILVGQLDNHSVEIEINGEPVAFKIGPGVSVAALADGSRVSINYYETADHSPAGRDTRPVLISISVLEGSDRVLEGEGIYSGQIDSHSVEIEVAGQPKAFALAEAVGVDDIAEGARVYFTYVAAGERLLLLTIKATEQPVSGGPITLSGEGQLIGLIDAQSVEILINRVFMLAPDIDARGISDGALVVFTFDESDPQAVIKSIEAVEQPVEGEAMHGTFIGWVDGRSVEIGYYQAFAIGQGVSLKEIADGSIVVFDYTVGEHRPVLTSLGLK